MESATSTSASLPRATQSTAHQQEGRNIGCATDASLPQAAHSTTNQQEPQGDGEDTGPKIQRERRVLHPDAEEYERLEKPILDKLKTRYRWMYLLTFRKNDVPNLIREEFGLGPKERNAYYSAERSSALELLRGWKSNTMKRMRSHIREVKRRDAAKNSVFGMCRPSNEDDLFQYFVEEFSPFVFFEIFYWVKPIVDYDKSSELGQYYIKNVYANLAVEVKLYIDAEDTPSLALELKGRWDRVLEVWDFMRDRDEYKEVDKGDFAEKLDEIQEPQEPAEGDEERPNKRIKFSGPVPKKTSEKKGY